MCLSERFCLGLSENSNIINVVKFHIFYYKLHTICIYKDIRNPKFIIYVFPEKNAYFYVMNMMTLSNCMSSHS